jgi:hypothetical protein
MASSLLVPISVTAKLIATETQVPALDADPFSRGDSLEPGIHLHWALPDAHTRARKLPNDKTGRTLFPGVPSLWLVVRIEPVSPASPQPRATEAWIVDSRAQSTSPLARWAPPTSPTDGRIHTLAGLLPVADRLGWPGWGIFDPAHDTFNPATAAYYPAARNRFGFHDPLANLPQGSSVSYLVLGWYASSSEDPFFMSKDRDRLLDRLKLKYQHSGTQVHELNTIIGGQIAARALAAWKPTTLKDALGPSPTSSILQALTRTINAGGTLESRQANAANIEHAVPVSETAIRVPATTVTASAGPTEIICHGSVVGVPLPIAATPTAPLNDGQVHLHSTVMEAMAATASQGADTASVEMILDDLESQKDTHAGVLDMPGAAHAKTFQGYPGKSSFYFRINIFSTISVAEVTALNRAFAPAPQPTNSGGLASGHWPPPSADTAAEAISALDPKLLQKQVPLPTTVGLSPAAAKTLIASARDGWIAQLRANFENAKAQPATDPTQTKTIDPKLIDSNRVRVQDYRKNAQPTSLGATSDPNSPDQAGYWLDMNDDEQLAALYEATRDAMLLPFDPHNLYEVPGERWYRPWSPLVLLLGAGRSYRFGEDGRFEPDGYLRCRTSAQMLSGITPGPLQKLNGADALAPNPLLANAGLPTETHALVAETILLDAASAPVLARSLPTSPQASSQVESAIHGLWLSRDPDASADEKQAIAVVGLDGTLPSPVAITPWKDPADALFVDIKYSHPYSSLETDWTLPEDSVELIPTTATATQPPPGQVRVLSERSLVTSTIPKVIHSAIIDRVTLDFHGTPAKALAPPQGLSQTTFLKLDVLSAPLTSFDELVFQSPLRQRTGALRLDSLDLIDVYGLARSWNSSIDPNSTQGSSDLPFWTTLAPRLPYWSRLSFQLQAATNREIEATPDQPPVCGFLLPDLVDHSIQIFDAAGNAIGEVGTDPPQAGSTDAKTLEVNFTPYPWVTVGADPFAAMTDTNLRAFVRALADPSGWKNIPAQQPDNLWFESRLTAFMRVVDTIRATIGPKAITPDPRVRLLGEPMALLTAGLEIDASATANLADLRGVPPQLPSDPALPTVSVRVGDATRPDDGVLGCFIAKANPGDSRFAPVSAEAVTNALLSGFVYQVTSGPSLAATDPFVAGQVSEFPVTVGQQTAVDLLILADARASLYATCGVLPRKKITLHHDYLQVGLQTLEPTFRAGPNLIFPTANTETPAVPAIDLTGYDTRFVREQAEAQPPADNTEIPIPTVEPVAALPAGRATVGGGWLRLKRQEKYQPPEQVQLPVTQLPLDPGALKNL